MQLIVFDSALAGREALDPAKARDAFAFNQYQQQFLAVNALAAKPGVNSIFLNHHPILGYAIYNDRVLQGGNRALLSVMNTVNPLAYYPSAVQLAMHGHVHVFEAISFSSNHPATMLSGTGGTDLDMALPDPFPMQAASAEGVTLESITHSNQFGFVVMDKTETNWQVSAYDVQGKRRATCFLNGSKLKCDKTGLLK
jgi:3',5'-cyclic AMP phosphodiesterase CpdA